MVFQPYTRKFTLQRESLPVVPISMTQRVQLSFNARHQNHTAFKIVPQYRLPPIFRDNLDQNHEWGAQIMFTGGVLGSVITQDLAKRTEPQDVLSASWEMPGARDGEVHEIFSVMVRSKGDAQTFPPDPLMKLHAEDLAEETRGAHVFHFYDEMSAMLFQDLLLARIHEVARETFCAA